MKLSLDSGSGIVVTGTGAGWIRVGSEEIRENVVLTRERVLPGWAPAGFDALVEADLAALLAHEPEVVILGSGPAQRFAHPRLLRPLLDAGIGVESMATPAACRTFNILNGEGRRVVAALIVTGSDPARKSSGA
ncbi:hypothetical protein BURK1_03288 [Burkholderiales bacterium]|nr:hypothetical protein BURK1_03288 [Burkholderiales bacterium]